MNQFVNSVLSVVALFALVACDDRPEENEACVDSLIVDRATFVDESIAALRQFYSVDGGFEGGVILFQELRYEDIDCSGDGSSLSYKVTLPEALRPREQDTHVAMVWGLDGTPWIFVMDENDEPFVQGQNPLSAILNLNTGVTIGETNQLADLIAEDFPRADVEVLEDTTADKHGISVTYGIPLRGIEDPTITTEAIAVHAFARNNSLVNFVNLAGWGRTWSDVGGVQLIGEDSIEVDCLRSFSAQRPLQTLSSLAAPMGLGRHYNLAVCPISNWPDECEFLSSPECIEAMQ